MGHHKRSLGLLVGALVAGVGHASIGAASEPAGGEGTKDVSAAADQAQGAGTAAMPAGHPSNAGTPALFQPPPDREDPDPALPPGTIVVELLDADERPVASETVTLGMLINSIAKGDSRKREQAVTDGSGRVVFSGLDTASNIAYRVSSGFQGGTFAAAPFQLEHAKAMHVVLHVYLVTHDLRQALIVTEVTIAAEVRDDRIQLEELLKFYNVGRTAWQPENVRMTLPEGFKALTASASMSDQRVDEVDGTAALKGTFPPGQHSVEFRWQLPWAGEKDFDFDVGLPPNVAIARVVMPAASNLKLMVAGFPATELRHDSRGQKFLVTERQLRHDDPMLSELAIGIHGLPTSGPGRFIATGLAALSVAIGLALSFWQRPSNTVGDTKRTRTLLLEELAEIERARLTGEVGPKTYERARRDIVDALARTLATKDVTG